MSRIKIEIEDIAGNGRGPGRRAPEGGLPRGVRHVDPLQGFGRRVAEAFRHAANRHAGARGMTPELAYREFRRGLLSVANGSAHVGHPVKIPSAGTFQRVLSEIVAVAGHRCEGRSHDRSTAT